MKEKKIQEREETGGKLSAKKRKRRAVGEENRAAKEGREGGRLKSERRHEAEKKEREKREGNVMEKETKNPQKGKGT